MDKPYDLKAKPPVDVLIENVQMLCEEYGSQMQHVRTQLDSATAEIARLQAELAEAREDRERLEAVQRHNWTVHYRSMHSRWEVLTDHAHPAHRKTYTGKTARAAIDAARKGEE
jgi:chromosome segregation ATPase